MRSWEIPDIHLLSHTWRFHLPGHTCMMSAAWSASGILLTAHQEPFCVMYHDY